MVFPALLGTILMIIGGPALPIAASDYVAYSVTDKGETPLPADLTAVADESLVQVKWGDFNGPKMRVAVFAVSNESTAASFQVTSAYGEVITVGSSYYNQVPVNGIDAILDNAMHQTGRFQMLERTDLDGILDEQDLGTSGRVSAPSAAKTGKVLGAKYLIKATVTHYEPDYKGKKFGGGGLTRRVLGGTKIGKSKSMVGMVFKLIDAETSTTVESVNVEVIVGKMNWAVGGLGWGGSGVLGGFLSSYSKTPVGQAVSAAVNKGVFEIVKHIGNQPLRGTVVAVKDGQVILNLGAGSVKAGDAFEAQATGEEFIDPETGLSLGAETETLGQVQITRVQEKMSYARPVGFDADQLKRGDVVVATGKPSELRFADSWEGKKK
jgi:curli biogenesis system outer membrane secretion channel CsgG